MQHFLVTMKCGHGYQVSAVNVVNGEPFNPDYVGKTMPARCCAGDHTVTAQTRISYVTGKPEVVSKPAPNPAARRAPAPKPAAQPVTPVPAAPVPEKGKA